VNIDSLSDSTTVPLNSSVTISVSVSGGSGSYTYQWQKNTGDISGAVSSSYTINPFHEINAGIYRVFVNDGIETIISNDVVLSYPLAIDTQPQSQALAIGAPLTLSVGVSGGSGVYTYQWKKNTVNISGATSGTYNISHSAASDAGSYTVVVNDGLTSQTSSAAIITSNFTIIAQPVSQGTYFGGTIPLSVVLAGGSGSYTYQWKKDGSNVLSATDSTYSITNFSSAKFGSYTVSTGDGTSTILSDTAFISGTTTIVDMATDTTQISQNGHLYGTSFVWELDPKTLVPIRVTTKHNF
jgi:hypothetical protein